MQVDHVVIFVSDLARATSDFSDLGFQITKGGSHARTENALIVFADGTYIELLALKRNWLRPVIRLAGRVGVLNTSASRKSDMYWRLLRWISGGTGLVDWCVRTDDLSATLGQWKHHGLDIIEPEPFDRLRLDGKRVEWYLGAAKNFDLPFLLEDITPINLRIPLEETPQHPNEALGLREVVLHVDDIAKTNALYAHLNIWNVANVSLEEQTPDLPRMNLKLTYSGTETRRLDVQKCHNAHIWMMPAS